jgi:hypothetical protein
MSHPPGLWPVPGDGVLARHGELILLSSLESGQFADVLLDLLEQIATSGGDGRRFADAVADALEIDAAGGDQASGSVPGPSVLAFGPAGAGLAVTVSGNAWADVVTEHGTQRLCAGQPGMLLRCLLRFPASAVRGGLGPADDGEARTDRFSRLDGGTVRAGGLAFFPGTGTYQRQPARPAEPPERQAIPDLPTGAELAATAQVPGAQFPDGRPPDAQPAEPPAPAMAGDAFLADATPVDMPPDAEPDMAPADVPPTAVSPGQAPPADVPPADVPAAEMPQGQAPFAGAPAGGGLLVAEPWPPLPGDPAQGAERWPTAAALIPQMPAAGDQAGIGTPDGPVFPQGGAVDLGERDVTIAPAGQPFEAVLLSGPGSADLDVPQRPPLSKAKDLPAGTSSYSEGMIISGVYCKNGHFDDPEALFCAVCGISMNQQTLVPRPGPRPPLGVLVLDDGAVFQLDKDYIIGREPSLDASVASGRSRPLRVADDSGIVSRVHAKVQLDGWRVLISDLGSANGTRVKLPRQPADQGLLPQVPVVLVPGSQIDLGGRGFRYESHRGR